MAAHSIRRPVKQLSELEKIELLMGDPTLAIVEPDRDAPWHCADCGELKPAEGVNRCVLTKDGYHKEYCWTRIICEDCYWMRVMEQRR
jgi:hypothetical protein